MFSNYQRIAINCPKLLPQNSDYEYSALIQVVIHNRLRLPTSTVKDDRRKTATVSRAWVQLR